MKRPWIVTGAAVLELLLAAVFLESVIVGVAFGPAAQRAAEAELLRQGIAPALLTGENLRFDEGVAGTVPALIIAVILIVLAVLNLRGLRIGRLLSWILQPLLVIAGAILVSGQVFLEPGLESALAGAGIGGVDVSALVAAASSQFPPWHPVVAWAKLILITVGQLVTIVLLALPPTGAYLRHRNRNPRVDFSAAL